MIWESFYWKADLLKQAAVLKKRIEQKRWHDSSLARCEQTIMLGFYSVRKLIESRKLTDKVSKMSVRVRSHAASGRTVHMLNRYKFDELYDFTKSQLRAVSLRFLSNQVIHSYAFSLLLNEDDNLCGILVTSDWNRSKELLEVDIQKIIHIFEKVGNDEVNSIVAAFDEKKGDYVYTMSHKARPGSNKKR